MSIKSGFGEFCWHELQTSNVLEAKEFYSNLLGWTFQDHSIGAIKYTMIKSGENIIGGIMASTDNKAQPYWTSYISVEDIDSTLAKTKKLGGSVLTPSTKMSDDGKLAIISDPTGAPIALWQSLKISKKQ